MILPVKLSLPIKVLVRGSSIIALAISSANAPAWAQDEQRDPAGVAKTEPGLATGEASAAAGATAPGETAAVNEADSGKEIVVTGSHLGRSSFSSPTPVNVVGSQRMQDLAIPNIADALNQLPSFRPAITPTSQLFRVSGSIGANAVDLRGLGGTRTLTLLDGRRFVPSTDNGTVDLNGIPSGMVQRAEVVTGGASAAYGADAVAGVVNIILDTKFTGIKTDFNAGISQRGDNKNVFASIVAGHDFADGRGHFVIGGEYQKNWGVGGCETRAFCKRYVNYIGNPGYINGVSTNGLPATLVLPNIVFVENPTGILVSAVQTVNGVRTTLGQQINNTGATALPAALRGLQFNQTGTGLVPFQFGNFLSGTFMQGGDPSVDKLYGFDANLVTSSWHASVLAHADFELPGETIVSGEFLYSRVAGGPVISQTVTETPIGGSAGISINNPYITPEVRAQILAANPNITALNVFVAKPEYGSAYTAYSGNDVFRGVLAAKGRLFANWKWDLSYTHGETHSRVDVSNARLSSFDVEAANAITPPSGYTGPIYATPAGAPVICASSVANPANGCIPVNFLGANSISQAALDKYRQREWQTRSIKQDDIAANLHGTILRLPAGPLDAAIGVEWRRDTAGGRADAVTTAGLLALPQVSALPTIKRNVIEGYIEASVPILADLPFAKSLTVDGAVRRTHYNDFGGATTWKVGGVYEPIDQIMVRVTRSHDIRAPTAAESNPNTTRSLPPIVDPFAGVSSHVVTSIAGGNPDLSLESANTFTAGIVLRPNFVPRFRVSVDYYKIDVDKAIDTLATANIVTACFQQNLLCNLIQFSGAPKASPVSTVFSNFQNLSKLRARGYELVAEYTVPNVLKGDLHFILNGTYVPKLVTITATGFVTRFHGVTGNSGSIPTILGVPSYKIDGVVTYSRPSWSITAHGRYIPKSILDPNRCGPTDACYNINSSNSININRVSSRMYFDLSGSIKTRVHITGNEGAEIYGSVSNVFDTIPPAQLRFFGNPLYYDVVGRAFRLGVRTKW